MRSHRRVKQIIAFSLYGKDTTTYKASFYERLTHRLRLGVSPITILIIPLLLCIIYVFPCHWSLGALLSKGGRWIFNVRNDLSACYACAIWTAKEMANLTWQLQNDGYMRQADHI